MTIAATEKLQDLREVIDAYNDLAERLQESQTSLQREVARLHEEIAEKNRQIARKNRLEVLGEMAAGVAHEIRNPLGGIDLYAGLIAREARKDEKVRTWAHKIQFATRDLAGIVGEILDFTRPLRPCSKPVVLDDVVSAALDLASSSIEKAGVSVNRLCAKGAQPVPADFNLLQRAFLNVIINAAEATRPGDSLTITVAPASLNSKPATSVSFADTGDGIPPEALQHVFDPFFTGKQGGTGLGLAMTSRIVAAHSGRLTAENSPTGGAIFTFVLPVEKGGATEATQWPE